MPPSSKQSTVKVNERKCLPRSERTLRVRGRYFCDSTPEGVPCREENFLRREVEFELSLHQTALVLVDLWNCHHIESWIERVEKVLKESILPVIGASRRAGLTVVHAPSPTIAAKYRFDHGKTSPPSSAPSSWPPLAFRERKREFARFRGPREQPPGIGFRWRRLEPLLDIHPLVKVEEGECVVATGGQLHDLCAEKGILHLVYAGFATNWCISNRDYGIVAMRSRGYNTMLLRDATEGIEFPDTLDKRWATELAIREVEQRHGFSVSNQDFLKACQAITDQRSSLKCVSKRSYEPRKR